MKSKILGMIVAGFAFGVSVTSLTAGQNCEISWCYENYGECLNAGNPEWQCDAQLRRCKNGCSAR